MKKTKWLALFAVFALVLAACGDGDDTTDTTADGGDTETTEDGGDDTTDTTEAPDTGGEAGQGGELVLLQWQAASGMNPFLSGGTKELLASSIVLEPLARVSPEGELVPYLAAEIPTVDNGGVTEDLTSITWTLKEGLLWSDGTPVTANDVVFTWEYCTNTPDCAQSSSFTGVTSVEAVDDTTVTVNFEGPTPYPYTAFVSFQSPILQQAQFENCVGADAAACTDENFGPIGTGPFMVTEFRTNDVATLEMNPNYRGVAEGKPFFGTVTIQGGGDAESTVRSVLELGEADYAWNAQIAPEVIEQMEAAGLGTVKAGFSTLVERIMVNQTNPDPDLGDLRSEYQGGDNAHPFLTDPAVYTALSMAIDRDALVEVGYGSAGEPTCNVWPAEPANSTNNDWCLTQDIEGANQMLEDAGYVDSDGDGIREDPDDGQPLSVLYQTSTNAVRQSNQDLVKANWEEIGVETELKNVDASIFFGGDPASPDTYQKFYADLEMYANVSGSPDSQVYMSNWTCDEVVTSDNFGGSNIARWCDPEYDALWQELTQTSDLDQRAEITIQLNDMIVEGGALIPLINRGNASAVANSIQGIGDINGWDSEWWNIADWTRSE